MMPDKKRRRDIWDLDLDEEDEFPLGHEPIGVGSGYSMSITYDDNGKPTVQVKTYGDVNKAELRKEIKQRYPEANIVGLESEPIIRIVNKKEKPRKKKSASKREKNKKSLIKVIE